jgi:hypothetical protein
VSPLATVKARFDVSAQHATKQVRLDLCPRLESERPRSRAATLRVAHAEPDFGFSHHLPAEANDLGLTFIEQRRPD